MTHFDEEWTPLDDDKSLFSYGRLLHHFTHALLVTIDDHKPGYKIPLTDEDKERTKTLKLCLQGKSETKLLIDTFHDFIKPLLYPKKAALWLPFGLQAIIANGMTLWSACMQ